MFERGDIKLEAGIGAPTQSLPGDFQKTIGLRQCALQLVEQVTQVRAGLRFRRIRPEEVSDMLPRLRSLAMKQEIGEQGLQTRQGDADELVVAVSQANAAQELDLEHYGHGDAPGARPGCRACGDTLPLSDLS